VTLEAMSFENAVFSTNKNGASEILDDNFIMDGFNDFSIVSKIDKLLKDQVKLDDIKKDNRLKSQQFSIEKNLEATLKIINEVIS
jgi:UDP-glucose:(heptosyl)LPS alpha-1,3-glucosyltransferase